MIPWPGDAGARLSGGERQRITIARAMLKQASVIILDEATAYADPENEALIPAGYQQAGGGKVSDCRGPPAEYNPQCRPDIGCCQR